MIVQYASDLHLDFAANLRYVLGGGIRPEGDVLVLAGDVVNLFELERFADFWDWCAKNWRQTIFVPGNHDYYGIWREGSKLPRPRRFAIRPNVSCCSNAVVRLGATDFVCSTLWSRVSPEQTREVGRLLLDFQAITLGDRPLTVADYNGFFEASWRFVRQAVADCDEARKRTQAAGDIVVVTHHVPTFAAVADYRKDSPVGTGFTTELGDWIADSPVKAWIYGHSHDSVEVTVGKTRVLSNQLGYLKMKEGRDFAAAKTLECA